MPNLDERIGAWRESLRKASAASPETLDELEQHLREHVEELVRSGMPEATAFHRAVKQLGDASTIAAEFQKLHQAVWWPIKVVAGVEMAVALALAMFLVSRLGSGRWNFLLAAHVFTVTLGYLATFLVGALGICSVAHRSLSELSSSRAHSLNRATYFLGWVAASLTAAGIILGMLWAKAEWGRYWAWDVKEVGGLAVITWQVCFLFSYRLACVSTRGLLGLSLLGNIVVSLGWFGANLLSGLHAYDTSLWLLLLAGVASNLLFLLLGWAPPGWVRRAGSLRR
jgi:hypothetical protein